jgi:hypothetical protein
MMRVSIPQIMWSGMQMAVTAATLACAGSAAFAADFDDVVLPESVISGDSEATDAAPDAEPRILSGDTMPGDDAFGSPDYQDCPHGADCQPGNRCDACDPPYGMINRLIDNKHACWTFRTDALLLWRDAPRDQPLINTSPEGFTALNANQLESTPAAGPRFSLFRTNGCGDALEATYFRAANFRSQNTLPTVANGYTPALLPVPATYDSVSTNLGSSLQSFELNGRMKVLPSIQLLGGFRWFQWQENLQVNGFSAGTQDVFSTSCMNDLYGYQIGFDSLLLNTRWMRLEGLMKGGAYYNNSRQITTESTFLGSSSARADTPKGAAFVGEVGLTGVMPITRNIDFRVGYLGLWLQGLAQPSNQPQSIDPNTTVLNTSLNTTGTAVVQGITLGLEGRW